MILEEILVSGKINYLKTSLTPSEYNIKTTYKFVTILQV